MEQVTFEMSWGVRTYRFSGRSASGFPLTVEWLDGDEWRDCPNVNVHIRIARHINASA